MDSECLHHVEHIHEFHWKSMQVPFATVVDIRIDKDPLVAGCLDGSIRQHIVTVSTEGRKEVQERVWAFGLIFLDFIWIWFSARIDQPKQATQIRCKCWLGWLGNLGMVPRGSCFAFGLWHGPGRNDQDTSSSKSFRRNQRVGWLRVSLKNIISYYIILYYIQFNCAIHRSCFSASKTNPSDISLSALFEGSPSVACCFWNCHVQKYHFGISHMSNMLSKQVRLPYFEARADWAMVIHSHEQCSKPDRWLMIVGYYPIQCILSSSNHGNPYSLSQYHGMNFRIWTPSGLPRCGRSLPWNSYECGRSSGRWWNTLCCSWGHPAICGSVYLGAILCHGHEGRHKKTYMFFCSWNHVLSPNHSASSFLTSNWVVQAPPPERDMRHSIIL